VTARGGRRAGGIGLARASARRRRGRSAPWAALGKGQTIVPTLRTGKAGEARAAPTRGQRLRLGRGRTRRAASTRAGSGGEWPPGEGDTLGEQAWRVRPRGGGRAGLRPGSAKEGADDRACAANGEGGGSQGRARQRPVAEIGAGSDAPSCRHSRRQRLLGGGEQRLWLVSVRGGAGAVVRRGERRGRRRVASAGRREATGASAAGGEGGGGDWR
jgi:hypothetical protein